MATIVVKKEGLDKASIPITPSHQNQHQNQNQTFSFGVIADVQYADIDDGSNFAKTVTRRYRNSLRILKAAIDDWLLLPTKTKNGKGKKIRMILQLGDLLDGYCATKCDKMACLKSVVNEFERINSNGNTSTKIPRFDVIGNHELYVFTREELHEMVTKHVGGGGIGGSVGGDSDGLKCLRWDPVLKANSTWYSYLISPGFRVIVLDSFDISTLNGEGKKTTEEAFIYLKKHNPNDVKKFGVDWGEGLSGLNRRNVPFNGAIGKDQLEWLAKTLVLALDSNEKCLIASHISLTPNANGPMCIVWNYEEVLNVIWNPKQWNNNNDDETKKKDEYEDRNDHHRGDDDDGDGDGDIMLGETPVVACMYGHAHKGGFFIDRRGISHITFQAPLEAIGNELAYATVHVDMGAGKLMIEGKGRVPSRICPFPDPLTAVKMKMNESM